MRLKAITLNGFRGFSNPQRIEFGSSTTVVFGENGSGKSSIHEGIEWVLTDKISRCESDARGEYKGPYLRSLRPAPDKKTWVCITMDIDGKEHNLTRELKGTEKSVMRIESGGRELGSSISTLGLDEASLASSFLAQNKFKRLLEAEPSQRWSRFVDILGLKELEEARGSLKQAISQVEKDATITNARAVVSHQLAVMKLNLDEIPFTVPGVDRLLMTIPSTKTLRQSSDFAVTLAAVRGHVDSILRRLKAEASEILAVDPEVEVSLLCELLKRLEIDRSAEAVRLEAQLKVVTTNQWELPPSSQIFLEFDWDAVQQSLTDLISDLETLVDHLRLLHENPEGLSLKLQFYEFGLRLMSDETCPFCSQPVNARTLRSHVEEFCQTHSGTDNVRNDVAKEIQAIEQKLRSLLQAHRAFLSHEEVIAAVRKRAEEVTEELNRTFGIEAFSSKFDLLYDARVEIPNWSTVLDKLSDEGLGALVQVEMALREKALVESSTKNLFSVLKTMMEQTEAAKRDQLVYRSLLSPSRLVAAVGAEANLLRSAVDQKIKDLNLERVTALGRFLGEFKKHREAIEEAKIAFDKARESDALLLSFEENLSRMNDLIVVLEEAETSLAATTLGRLADRIKQFYGAVNPLDDFQFSSLVVDSEKKRIGFLSEICGTEVNPVTHFSEAHLNCMGLAVFLATAETADTDFVLLDDPVQSMDSNHRGAVARLLREEFEGKKQLLIATHEESFFEALRVQFNEKALYWRVDGWSIRGPVLTSTQPVSLLERARDHVLGGRTDQGANLVRQFLEHYLDKYLKAKKVPVQYGQTLNLNGKIDALRKVAPPVDLGHITNLQMARVFGNWGSHFEGPDLSKGDVLSAIKIAEEFAAAYPHKEAKDTPA